MHERTTVRKKTGLRTQMMTLMLILCTLALLIQGCLLIYASVRFYSEKAYDDMEFFLQTCNSNFSSKMLYVEGVVNNLRGDPMMQSFFSDEGFNWVEIRSQFEFCTNIVSEQNLIDSREPFVSEIYLFNRNGNYLRENYYSLPNDEQKAHDRYYEALFEAFSDGEPVIRHTLTEQTLYLFAPFYDQRMQVCGMFAAGIDRTALEQLLGEIDRYDDAFCVLLGADAGLSIQHNCALPEESLERFLTLEGGLQSFSLDGTQYLLMPGSRSFHLRTIAAVPQRQVYSTVAPLLRLLVCLIVVLVPLAAAAVSVAVWKSTKPVQAMTDKIRLFGKGHKERMVYLNDACVEALQLYLNKRNVMEGLSPKERAVFVTRRRKERISNRRVEQLVTGAMKAAGLKGFSTHKLRHTAATLMYQTGNVDILTLKQLLGHSSVGTTQIYTHLQEFQVRAAIEENPLGKASRKKPGKADLDTTEAETGESREESPGSTAEATENSATAVDSSAPMAAFDGSAKEGFGLDTETLAANSDADTEK